MSASQTSIEAYAQLVASGYIGERHRLVLECFKKHGAMTCGEAFEQMKAEGESFAGANGNVTSRCSELEEMGVMQRIGTKECRVTKKNVTLWEAIEGAVAHAPVKKLKNKEIIAQLTERIRELEAEVAYWKDLAEIATRPTVVENEQLGC